MAKKVRVQLFGRQNRSIMVDADATEGATFGKNIMDESGAVITLQTIIQQTTQVITNIINNPPGVVIVVWSAIQQIPAFILSLAGLSGTGIVVKGAGDTAVTRSIVPEDDRITVADGDGVAGNPTIGMTNWPRIKASIESSESYTVPPGYQILVSGAFDVEGTLDAQGSVAIL